MTARPVGRALPAGIAWAGPLYRGARGSLAEAAERTRQASIAHDAVAVVGAVATVVLQIPGADPSAPVERAQAVALLRRYFQTAGERGLTVRGLREPDPGRDYVELERPYVVAAATACDAKPSSSGSESATTSGSSASCGARRSPSPGAPLSPAAGLSQVGGRGPRRSSSAAAWPQAARARTPGRHSRQGD